LIAILCIADLALVGTAMRVLSLHPTPAFATGSVRRTSGRMLRRPPTRQRARRFVPRHQVLDAQLRCALST
jgi:hypothetical protein